MKTLDKYYDKPTEFFDSIEFFEELIKTNAFNENKEVSIIVNPKIYVHLYNSTLFDGHSNSHRIRLGDYVIYCDCRHKHVQA